MAGTIADFVVKLRGEGGSQVARELDTAGRAADSFSTRTTNLGRTLTGQGALAVASFSGLTAPILGLGAVAVTQASDLNEAMSAATVTYGTGANSIISSSENAASAVGLSQEQYLSAATVLGVAGTTAGLTGDALAGFGQETIGAAADMASFYNAPVPEALAAIQAGLRGESDPLERFGVQMNQAAVEAYALENGIWDGTGAMDAQQLTLARQGYIMDNLGAAQGDFSRTSDGLANSQRILQAQLKDLAASFGQVLLPIVLSGVTVFRNVLDAVLGLPAPFKTAAVVVAGLAAAAGPALIAIGTLGPAFGTGAEMIAKHAGKVKIATSTMFGPVGIAIAAGIALFTAYKTNFLGFGDAVDAVAGKVRGAFEAVGGVISSFGKYLKFAFTDGDALNDWLTHLPGPLQGIAQAFGNVASFLGGLGDRIAGISTTFANLRLIGVDPLDAAFRSLKIAFPALSGAIGAVQGVVTSFVGTLQSAWQYVKDAFNMRNAEQGLERFSGALRPIMHGIGKLVDTAADFRAAWGEGGIMGVLRAVPDELGDIRDAFVLIFSGIGQAIGGFFADLPGRIIGAIGSIGEVVGNLGGIVGDALSDAGAAISEFGGNLPVVGPLFEAIGGAVSSFGDKVSGMAETVRSRTRVLTNAFDAFTGNGINPVRSALMALGLAFPALTRFTAPILQAMTRLSGSFSFFRSQGMNPVEAGLRALGQAFPALKGPITGAIAVFDTVRETVGEVIDRFRDFRELGMNPVQAALAALTSVFPGFTATFERLGGVVDGVMTVFRGVRDAITSAFSGDWSGVVDGLTDAFGGLVDVVKNGVATFPTLIVDAFNAIPWSDVGSALLTGAQAAFGLLGDAASALWDFLGDSVSAIDFGAIGSAIMDGVRSALGALGELADWTLNVGLPALGGAILSLASGAWSWITGQLPGLLSLAGDIASWTFSVGLPTLGGAVLDFAGDLWGWVKEGAAWLASALAPSLPDFSIDVPLPGIAGTIVGAFSSLWDWVRSKVPWLPGGGGGSSMGDWIGSAGNGSGGLSVGAFGISVPVPDVAGAIVGAFSSILDWVKSKVPWVSDAISCVVQTFDISSGVPAVAGAIVGAFSNMCEWVRAGVSWLSLTISDTIQSFDLSSGIPAVAGAIVGAFGSMWDWAKAGVSWLSDGISGIVNSFDLSSGVPSVSGAIVGAFGSLWDWIRSKVSWLSDPNVVAALQSFNLSSGIPAIGGAIVGAFANIWEWAKAGASWLTDTFTATITIAANAVSGAVSVAADFVSKIMGGIADAAGWLWDNTAGRFTSDAEVEVSANATAGTAPVGATGEVTAPPPLSASEVTAFAQAYEDAQRRINGAIALMLADVSTLKTNTVADTNDLILTTQTAMGTWTATLPIFANLAATGVMTAVSTMKIGVVSDVNDLQATTAQTVANWNQALTGMAVATDVAFRGSVSTMKVGVVADVGDMVNTTIALGGAWNSGLTAQANATDASVRGAASRMKVGVVSDVGDMVNTSIARTGAWQTATAAHANSTDSGVRSAISRMKIGVVSDVSDMVNTSIAKGGAMATGLRGQADSAASGVIGAGQRMRGEFVGAISGMAGEAVGRVQSMVGQIIGAANSGAGGMSSAGRNIGASFGQGIVNGMAGYVNAAASQAAAIVNAAISAARNAQESASPSKVMTREGRYFGQGYVRGVEQMVRPARVAAENLVAEAVRGARAAGDRPVVGLLPQTPRPPRTGGSTIIDSPPLTTAPRPSPATTGGSTGQGLTIVMENGAVQVTVGAGADRGAVEAGVRDALDAFGQELYEDLRRRGLTGV